MIQYIIEFFTIYVAVYLALSSMQTYGSLLVRVKRFFTSKQK